MVWGQLPGERGVKKLFKAVMVRRADGERGAYAILFAILIVVLFIMVALAVDLSDARARVKENRNRVDFAGLAAGQVLLEEGPWEACLSAWNFIKTNTPGFPTLAISPCRSIENTDILTQPAFQTRYLDGDEGCDPLNGYEYYATGEEPYEVIFTYPVTDAQLDSLSSSDRSVDPSFDGADPCERFGVTMVTDQGSLFGGIVGGDGIQAPATAVIRAFQDDVIEAPVALLLLDPVGCTALEGNGGGSETGGVQVYPSGDVTGTISVDSNGTGPSCTTGGGNYTVDIRGSGGGAPGRIWSCGIGSDPVTGTCTAGGSIELYASTGGLCAGTACEQADVDLPSPPPGHLYPQPVSLRSRRTRAPVDHQFNCQPYPPGDEYYVPSAETPATEVPLVDCDDPESVTGQLDGDADGYTTDYIDELVAYVGTSGRPAADAVNWSQYPLDFTGTLPTDPCRVQSGDTVVLPVGNWFINCSTLNINGRFEVQAGNVVVQGGVSVNGQFLINTTSHLGTLPSSCVWNGDDRPDGICPTSFEPFDYAAGTGASYLYLRSGNLAKGGSGGIIRLNGVMVYLHNGRIDIGGGSAEFTWIAPFHGTFEDLSLWSESSGRHLLNGSSGQNVEGSFFAPFANPFQYQGGGAAAQLKAQFLTYRMLAGGNGVLRMAPDPERAVSFPMFGWRLIR